MMSVIALRFFCCLFTFLVVVRCAHPSAILQDRMNSHNHMRRHVADGNGPCVTFSRVGELGRLGNQIFQVASTIGVAEKRDLCWFFTGRITDSSVSRLFDIPARSGTFEGLLIVHVEERQDFYEVTLPELQHGKHHDLYGYFQSPEYFEYSRATLASIFRPRPSLVNEVEATLPVVKLPNTVAIHVRRGDYVHLSQYNLLSVQYYQEALSLIEGATSAIVVSDDINWCKTNMEHALFALGYTTVVYSPFEDDIYDFVVLYLAHHLVMSASSFTWWAAYLKSLAKLRQQQSGKVIAPATWYNSTGDFAYLNRKSFYHSSWVLLDT